MDPLGDCKTLILVDDIASKEMIWGMPTYVCWILIGVLLLLSALFSACENAFSLCNKYHFRAEADKGKITAKVISKLVDSFDNTLTTVLIGNNAVNTLMSALCSLLFYNICQNNGWGNGVEVLFSTVIVGFLCYIIGDTIPKVISKALPNQMAILMAYPIFVLQYLIYPIVLLFRLILKGIHKLIKSEDKDLLSKKEIMEQIDDAINDDVVIESEEEKEKLFESDEKEIIDNVLDFDKRKIKSVYTPIDKVVSLDYDNLTADLVNESISKIPYSRMPVYKDDKKNIVGVLVIKIYFQEYSLDKHVSLPSILEQPLFLSSDETLDDAFEKMNIEKVHLAIVKEGDEVIGIVTMEDVLEELVENIDEKEVKDA